MYQISLIHTLIYTRYLIHAYSWHSRQPEFQKIADGTYAYGDWKAGRDFEHRALRLRTLIRLIRWSGLSILAAVTLERQRLQSSRLRSRRGN
jgi:hypothetical protein